MSQTHSTSKTPSFYRRTQTTVPDPTLNEAITMLMGDEARTAQVEVGALLKAQDQMREAVKFCRRELVNQGRQHAAALRYWARASDPVGRGDPYWPPARVVSCIELSYAGREMPSCVNALLTSSRAQSQIWDSYNQRYLEAMDRLFSAARNAKVRMFGRSYLDPHGRMELLPTTYFRSAVTIDRCRTFLGPRDPHQERHSTNVRTLAMEELSEGAKFALYASIYADVVVDETDLKLLLSGTDQTATSPAGSQTQIVLHGAPQILVVNSGSVGELSSHITTGASGTEPCRTGTVASATSSGCHSNSNGEGGDLPPCLTRKSPSIDEAVSWLVRNLEAIRVRHPKRNKWIQVAAVEFRSEFARKGIKVLNARRLIEDALRSSKGLGGASGRRKKSV
ncbi:MAG: hypothetical protein ABL908_02000 [Hyphomicrobium sp.]